MRVDLRSLALLLLAGCASVRSAPKEQPAPVPAAVNPHPSSAAAAKPSSLPTSFHPCTPQTRRVDVVDTLHGVQVADPYRWLEDEKSPEVQAWMEEQSRCAESVLHAVPGREALVNRLSQLLYVESISAPIRRGKRLFYLRTHADKEKAILYFREGEHGEEKVLLDPNQWSKDGTVSLGMWVPSWDGQKVAFTEKPNAADEAILHVVEVSSGEWSKVDVISGAKYAGAEWTPDSASFYYTWLPTDPSIPVADRPGYQEVRRHRLGTDPASDARVYPANRDPTTFVRPILSQDGKYLFISISRGWNENDLYFQKVGQQRDFTLLVKGKDALYDVFPWKDHFYISTDEGAPKGRLFRVAAKRPERSAWKEVIAEDPIASVVDFTVVGGHLAIAYLKDAATELRVATLEGKPVRTLPLPGIGTASNLVGLPNEDAAFYEFSSFTVPRQVFKTSVKKGTYEKWAEVKSPFEPSAYAVSQVRFPSKDGTLIPMFLVHRKDVQRNGENPVLLYGYGGFNVSLTPAFKASLIPWLEAGGVYAVANLRGGGEFGKSWHDAGKGPHKQNVFDDFVAAAEFLVNQRLTRPEKLAINGGSNGGLLVGAAMIQRPELFGAVVCAVPLLDMIRYHRFGSGKTWISEYGSADDEPAFKILRAYSPYQRVREGVGYPPLLMLSADHDDRVDPMHARKFVAAVQHARPSGSALLRIEKNAGHGGADQVQRAIEQWADTYSFLFQALQLEKEVVVK